MILQILSAGSCTSAAAHMEEDGSRQQVEQSKKGSSNTARRKSSFQKQGISVIDEPDRIPTPFPQNGVEQVLVKTELEG